MKNTVTAKEFAERIGVSEGTLKRRVYERRKGIDNGFPMPLFGEGKKLVWDAKTVEEWIENPSYGNLAPSPDTLRARKKSVEAARKGLKELGVDIKAWHQEAEPVTVETAQKSKSINERKSDDKEKSQEQAPKG